jgi:tetratricopeptide (TPR) repeat protein
LPHLRRARIGFNRAGDAHRAGIAACQLGIALRHLGRRREAAAALRWATAHIDVTAAEHLALAHVGMGNLHLDEGDHVDAQAAFERALAVLGPDANPATESNVLVCLGLVATLEGRHQEAVRTYRRALHNLVEVGDVANAGRVELLLAEAYVDHGDLANAARYGQRAAQTLLDVDDVVGQARAHTVIGQVHLADGRVLEAADALREACDRLERAGHHLPWARALAALGRARQALHDHAGARAAGQRALEIYEAHGRAEAGGVAAWLADLGPADHVTPATTRTAVPTTSPART